MRAAVVAFGASSALGEGDAALGVGEIGAAPPAAVGRDPELDRAKLARPYCARAAVADEARDRATVLFERALAACARDLDVALPSWRARRVGLAIGTSSGGMRTFERLFAGDAGASAEGTIGATYLGPVIEAARPCDLSPFAFVLGACASGTLAIGLAREWLLAGRCDVALCGGFDAVSVFVASGFEVLRAVCTEKGPRPFRKGRDGLALGEGAAILALVRPDDLPASRAPLGWVAGFGATCDAVHLTAPDREGRGLARAARQALEDAGVANVGLVSAHGTATDFNDASESRAIRAALGEGSDAIVVHALKGAIGHTLGAAGALESLSALAAMRAGIAPASVGGGEIDGAVRVLDRAEASSAPRALKLSAAFGGANAALVLTRAGEENGAGIRKRGAEAREVFVSRGVAVVGEAARDVSAASLAAATGYAEDRIARADGLVKLALAACAKLRDEVGSLEGAGIVVGHGLATMDTNAAYLERILKAGASRGEPRRFPYTTPNAAAGECAVAFGMTGPAFAVGGGPHGGIEALAVAADLLGAAVADRIVVVAVDEAGQGSRRLAPATEPGAVALLVSRGSPSAAARLESCAVGLPRGGATASYGPGAAVEAHRALLPLAEAAGPDEVTATTPWGGFANASFFWL
ncbi:MAG: 3-oxoacyl-ACP synthase [Labilithrix sp.]|nr:3-oxoacyl-ACP synthase [Labilithrix sp.]